MTQTFVLVGIIPGQVVNIITPSETNYKHVCNVVIAALCQSDILA